jgi:hypothetical protein
LEQLLASQPDNPVWRQDLAFTDKKLGMIYSEIGRFEDARRAFQQSRRGFEKLDSSSPNDNWKEELEFLDQRLTAGRTRPEPTAATPKAPQ